MIPTDPVAWAIKAFRDGRNDLYTQYAQYIQGDQPMAFATEKFRTAFGRTFEAFAYNRCEMVVDAHADRLQVEGFGADNEALSQQAQELWDSNQMDLREGHAEVDAFALGDSYALVEMHPERGNVQMWIQDPRTMRVHYADDVPGEIDLAAKMWVDADLERTRLNIYSRDRVEKYVSTSRTPSGVATNARAFEPYRVDGQAQDFRLNVTDTVPVFHFANNGRTNDYGVSEIRNVIPLQDALNKTLMDTLVAMEFAAYPQRVLIGVDEDDPESQATFQRFQVGMDRLLRLTSSESKIAEFSAANIAQYLAVAEFWDKTISRVTKVPVHYLGMSGDFTSGVSKRIAESPFTSKMEDRQRGFGNVWSAAVSYGLRLKGAAVAPGDLRVNWMPAAPVTDEDQLEQGLQKRDLGYPLPAILREMGYEPEQIDEIIAEKKAAVYEAERAFNAGNLPNEVDAA